MAECIEEQKDQIKMPKFSNSNGAGLEWRAFIRHDKSSKLDIFSALSFVHILINGQ